MQEISHRMANPATAEVYALQLKSLEAQMALYRGFLHEVNNALGGIGSLAEVLKDSPGPVLGKNLELIANTAQRAGALQRQIRTLYSVDDPAIDINLSEFLNSHKHLMEIMLHREQRGEFDVSSSTLCIKASISKLWWFISLCLLWVKESQMPKFSVKWGEEGVLKFALSSDYASEEWLTIFPQMAKTVGAHFSGNRQEVFFKFKN